VIDTKEEEQNEKQEKNIGNQRRERERYPGTWEVVFCTVTRITPFAAWCTLDEYSDKDNKVEGMIHVSEVAGRWVKDIRNFVKMNRQYVAKVIRVDPSKGHINLSLKRVSKFDKREKIENYRKGMRIENMLLQAANKLGKTLDDAEREVADKLYERFDDLYTALEAEAENPGVLAEAGVGEEWVEALRSHISKAFEKKELVIKADIELSSTAPDGVERVKDVLKDIEKDVGAKPRYISAPRYRVEIGTKDPKTAEKNLRAALDDAVKKIEQSDGSGKYEIVK